MKIKQTIKVKGNRLAMARVRKITNRIIVKNTKNVRK